MAIVSDNFDGYSTGEITGNGNWSEFGASTNVFMVSNAESVSANNSLFTDTGGDDYLVNEFTRQTDDIYVEIDFKLVSAANESGRIFLCDGDPNNANNQGMHLKFDAYDIEIYDGAWQNVTTGDTLASDTWYTLKITVDISADTFTIELDGVQKGGNWGFRTSQTGLDTLAFYTNGNSGADAYYDDLIIDVVAAGSTLALAGTIAATTAFVSSPILRTRFTLGTFAAVSGFVSRLSRFKLFQGSLASVATFSANPLVRLKRLVGSFAAVSIFVGALTKAGTGIKTLVGSISTSSSFTASISRLKRFTGTFADISVFTGNLTRSTLAGAQALAGTIAASSTVSATIRVVARLRNVFIQGIDLKTGKDIHIDGKIRFKKEK